ncbi:MAG: hypothetical protein ACK5U7_15120 [Bacteroidota bacterium]|jgi:hypothetical protein
MNAIVAPAPAPVSSAAAPPAPANNAPVGDAPVQNVGTPLTERDKMRLVIGTVFSDGNWFDPATAWRKSGLALGIPDRDATPDQKAQRKAYCDKRRGELIGSLLSRIEALRAEKALFNDVQGEAAARFAMLRGVKMYARSLTIGQALKALEAQIRGENRATMHLTRCATKTLG